MSVPSAAECIPPLGADELMLSIVRTHEDETVRTLEVSAGGLARWTSSSGPDETWLEPWGADQMLRALRSFAEVQMPPISGEDRRTESHFRLTLSCFDVDQGEPLRAELRVRSNDLEQELNAILRWIWRRIQAEKRQPIWVSGPSHPKICQPDYRQDLGLAVKEPFWCQGRVGGLSSSDWDEEKIQQLRERLRNLPRGLQEPGETSEERSPERTYSSVSLEPEPDTSSSDPPSPRR